MSETQKPTNLKEAQTEQKQIEEIRDFHKWAMDEVSSGIINLTLSREHVGILLSIIDNREEAKPKLYTESELREAFYVKYQPFEGVNHDILFKGWRAACEFAQIVKKG